MSDQKHLGNSPQSPVQQQMMYVQDDEIDLRELFWILWAEKWFIIKITSLAAILSVIVSLMMTEIFTAEATLAAAQGEQPGGGLSSQLGGAAALLGVNMPSAGVDNINTAIATLGSRQLIGKFIEDNNLLIPLFAGSWDKATYSSVIDDSKYNPETNEWLLENGAPSPQEAFRKFSAILNISGPDRLTGIVKVAINWHNPVEAADWVNKLVHSVNQDIRMRDVQEANNAILYLRSQLESTQLVDMQRVFYQLIESQTRITMLADVREEYVFRVIDPATVPDMKSAPRRALICIIGTMAGGLLSLLLVFVRRVFLTDSKSKS